MEFLNRVGNRFLVKTASGLLWFARKEKDGKRIETVPDFSGRKTLAEELAKTWNSANIGYYPDKSTKWYENKLLSDLYFQTLRGYETKKPFTLEVDKRVGVLIPINLYENFEMLSEFSFNNESIISFLDINSFKIYLEGDLKIPLKEFITHIQNFYTHIGDILYVVHN